MRRRRSEAYLAFVAPDLTGGRRGRRLNHGSRMIVIGASAGGVPALLRLLPDLGADFPVPVLVVLHIGAHRSHLAELVDARGPNRALLAQPGMTPQAGTIYFAPPDTHLLFGDGELKLFRGPKEHHARPAINPLFRSVALELGPRAIGVILTGLLDDGAAGLQAINACGGTTVVQTPEDAAESSMPLSAIAATRPDHITRLADMADLLKTLATHQSGTRQQPPEWLQLEHAISLGAGMQTLARIGDPSGFTCPDCGGSLFELKNGLPVRFLCHTGHAFSLRTLMSTHAMVADEALWAALRAVQEKEAILRRLGEEKDIAGLNLQQAARAEADSLAAFARQLRSIVVEAPVSEAGEASDELER